MALKGPNEEDRRKLHAEINQIVNQRFILATSAITAFAALTVWMIPKDAQAQADVGGFPFIVSTILSLLLTAIYCLSHQLKNTMRVFTQYLAETESSDWDLDWAKYREQPHSGYTRATASFFLVLNAVGFIFAFSLAYMYSVHFPCAALIFAVVVLVATEVLIYRMGYKSLFDNEGDIKKRWQELNAPPPTG
jgi:Flp pilus assembly protein TadB